MEIRKISYEDQQPGVPAVLPQPHSNIPCHTSPHIKARDNLQHPDKLSRHADVAISKDLYAWIFDFLCIHALHIPF